MTRAAAIRPKYALGEKVALTQHILNQVLGSMQQMATDYVRNLTEKARKAGRLKE